MSEEIEAKFRVNDHEAVLQALQDSEAKFLGTVQEDDCLYDFPDGSIRSRGSALRLRRTTVLRQPEAGDVDARPLLTFKGPRKQAGRAKVRPEHQTRVDDGDALRRALAGCGLRVAIRVHKRRQSYRLDGCRVEVDDVEQLGTFVEVEGPSESRVEGVCGRLGLHGPSVQESYPRMVSQVLQQPGGDE
jgi:predicted adenylyl cyclase CyaB